MMTAWSMLAASVLLSAAAQVAFKLALTGSAGGVGGLLSTLLRPGILFGLGLYGLSVLIWFGVLRRLPLSVAYPMVSVGFVLTAIAGVVIFGEALTATKVLGVLLIVAGVVVLAQGA